MRRAKVVVKKPYNCEKSPKCEFRRWKEVCNVRFAPVLARVYITAVPDSFKWIIRLRFLFFTSTSSIACIGFLWHCSLVIGVLASLFLGFLVRVYPIRLSTSRTGKSMSWLLSARK